MLHKGFKGFGFVVVDDGHCHRFGVHVGSGGDSFVLPQWTSSAKLPRYLLCIGLTPNTRALLEDVKYTSLEHRARQHPRKTPALSTLPYSVPSTRPHFARCYRGSPNSMLAGPNATTADPMPSYRTTSDSSVGLVKTHDRSANTWASFTSVTGGSGRDSGSSGWGEWRNGVEPAIRETEIGGKIYQIICAKTAGASMDSGGEADGGGAATEGGSGVRSGASGEGSEQDSGSSDGLGEITSVADITECFESIGDVSLAVNPAVMVSRLRGPGQIVLALSIVALRG